MSSKEKKFPIQARHESLHFATETNDGEEQTGDVMVYCHESVGSVTFQLQFSQHKDGQCKSWFVPLSPIEARELGRTIMGLASWAVEQEDLGRQVQP